MTIENEELSDDQLFNSAVDDEPAETPEIPAAVIEQPEKPATEVVAGSDTPAEKPVVDDNAPLIPSWRLREIREERDAVAKRLVDAEARLAQQPKVEAPKPAAEPDKPDPLLDPTGYAKAVREEIRQDMLNERREESLLKARESNQAEFDEAYAAAQKAVDPALRARMQGSRDPGKTLIEWHRENKVKAEVGSDPNAWLEKKLEERLKDPAFLAKAVELARGSAQSQPSNGRPRVELPPSLSGSSRANAALKSDNEDVSDSDLFAAVTG